MGKWLGERDIVSNVSLIKISYSLTHYIDKIAAEYARKGKSVDILKNLFSEFSVIVIYTACCVFV